MATHIEDGVIAVKLYSLEKQIEEKNKEIERLNNITDELEKWLESEIDRVIKLINPKKKELNLMEKKTITMKI